MKTYEQRFEDLASDVLRTYDNYDDADVVGKTWEIELTASLVRMRQKLSEHSDRFKNNMADQMIVLSKHYKLQFN